MIAAPLRDGTYEPVSVRPSLVAERHGLRRRAEVGVGDDATTDVGEQVGGADRHHDVMMATAATTRIPVRRR